MKEIKKRLIIKTTEITVNILFWIYIIYSLITNYDFHYFKDTINYVSSYNLNIFLTCLTVIAKIFLDFIQKIPFTFILLVMYIFYLFYRKNYINKKTYIINEFNIDERKKELSNIIKEASPLVLKYISNYKLTDTALATAKLIIKQKQENKEKLTLNEKYIVNCQEHNIKIDQDRLEREVVKDCKNKNLISKRKLITKNGMKFLIIWLILIIINVIFYLILGKISLKGAISEIYLQLLISLLFLITFGIIPLIGLIYFIPYILENSKNYLFRTNKAKDINYKLASLKYFIICLPYMDKKYTAEIQNWPEYKAYETLFKN